MCSQDYELLGLCHTEFSLMVKKKVDSSDQSNFLQYVLMCFLLFYKALECTAILWTDTLVSSVELSSSFRGIFGVFVASLMNGLLAQLVCFCGCPCCYVVPTPFFFLFSFEVRDLIVLCGRFITADIFNDLTLSCTSPQLCPWPVWRAPWSLWCYLLGGYL